MKVAFITDPIDNFDIYKDTTYMMMLSVSRKNWHQYVFEFKDIFTENAIPYGVGYELSITSNRKPYKWYKLQSKITIKLCSFDVIFMRKDPPVNMEFFYATYILEIAEKFGTLIINSPESLRNINEKFSVMNYPDLAPKTMVSRSWAQVNRFLKSHRDIIAKPLNSMSGESIFRIKLNDPNTNAIFEMITKYESQFFMFQKYQPGIKYGDKRILIIDGLPIEYLAARIPNDSDGRGNVSKGATVCVRKLNPEEYRIAKIVGKDLKKNGIIFAGIDIIDTHLTEINITSPTMAQQIFNETGLNAADILISIVEKKVLSDKNISSYDYSS